MALNIAPCKNTNKEFARLVTHTEQDFSRTLHITIDWHNCVNERQPEPFSANEKIVQHYKKPLMPISLHVNKFMVNILSFVVNFTNCLIKPAFFMVKMGGFELMTNQACMMAAAWSF